MGIKFSESTIKAGYLVETPDWYQLAISKHFTKQAETGSVNHFYIFDVVGCNPGELQEKMVGVPISKLINEKADWIALPLFKACAGGEVEANKEYEWESLVGITVEGYVKRGARQDGSPMNDIIDFAPLGTNMKPSGGV